VWLPGNIRVEESVNIDEAIKDSNIGGLVYQLIIHERQQQKNKTLT
jgi:hypothetical protein